MAQERTAPRKEQAAAWFTENQRLFRCPHCGKFLKMSKDGRLCCKKKHSFDITQKGYVNFAAAGELPGYDKALFQNRRQIFEQGFYDHIAGEIARLVQAYVEAHEGSCVILDAGCGEGFYTSFLARNPVLSEKARFIGVDLCRDAVAMATRYHISAGWCVADLARLPIADHSVDILLDILTPANYGEFGRLLKPGGLLIKAVPTGHYLREVREAVSSQLRSREYSNQQVVDYSEAHMRLLEKSKVSRRFSLSPEQSAAFLRMTPMTGHTQLDPALSGQVKEITVEMEILSGHVKA